MTEILTESFCERCGTRYTFETARPRGSRIGRAKVFTKGLRNYVLSDDSFSEAMADARGEVEIAATNLQLDAFHRTFNFCLDCRQYTCGNCWNAEEGRCISCAPLPALAPREIEPETSAAIAGRLAAIVALPEDEPAAAPALIGISAWPSVDLPVPPTRVTEPAAADLAEPPAADADAPVLDAPAVLPVLPEPPVDAVAPAAAVADGADVAAPAVDTASDAAPAAEASAAHVEPDAAGPRAVRGLAPGQSLEDAIAAYEAAHVAEPPSPPPVDVAHAPSADEADLATEPVTAQPEPVAAAPEPEQEPQSVAAEPAPVAAVAEPVAAQPESVTAKPEPVAAQPEPVATAPKPEPVAAAPEPVAAQPESVTAEPEPEPVAAQPEPEQEPQSVAAEPAPVAAVAEPQSVAAEPAPVAGAREPEPGPAAMAPVGEPGLVAEPEQLAPAQALDAPSPVATPASEPPQLQAPEVVAPVVLQPAAEAVPSAPPELAAAASAVPEAPAQAVPEAPAPPAPTQPQWLAVAPDDGAAPSWPVQPAWASKNRVPMAGTLAGRTLLPPEDAADIWSASAREVMQGGPLGGPAAKPGQVPIASAQPCVGCGLPLSVNARFCRRCGTRQG